MRTTSKKADIKYKLQNRKFRGNSKLVYNPFEFSPKNRRAKIIKESGNITETYQPSKSFHPVFEDLEHNVRLFQADCLEILDYVVKKEPLGYVDMIFADPPYFLSNGGITCHAGRMVSVNKGHWDKSRGPDANHEFNIRWLSACQKILKPNGTIWVSGTAHIIHSIGFAMQQLGFKILNDITWVKPNPPPNLSCRYFTHATETVIWAAKNSNSRHLFNYQEMRRVAGGKQMKSVWPIYPPANDEKVFGKHPTQKPVGLLERIISASSNPGDLVLDPFMGACTTGVAAVRLKRKFLGIELEAQYVDTAIKRIKQAIEFPAKQLSLATK